MLEMMWMVCWRVSVYREFGGFLFSRICKRLGEG